MVPALSPPAPHLCAEFQILLRQLLHHESPSTCFACKRFDWHLLALQVAGKLLHKELDKAQIAAMMEFAANVTIQSEGGQQELAVEHLINEEAFQRLVARFAAGPEEGE